MDVFDGVDQPNGKVEVIEGETYWMGTRVMPCPACGVAPTNVDDCGHFGDPDCPYFGIGREEYERRMRMRT